MTNEERKDKAREIAELAMEAFESLGCDAAAVLVDPGGDDYIITIGGNSKERLAHMVSQTSATILLRLAKDIGIDIPDAIMQRLARVMGNDEVPDMSRSKGIETDLLHLAEYAKKVRF